MIKRIVSTCFLVLALSIAAQAQMKVAVVDLKRAFDEYYRTKEAEASLKERMGVLQKEIQEQRDDYQKLVDEINKLKESVQDKTLAEAARGEKQKMLETKIQDAYNQERKMQEFREQRGRQFSEAEARMKQTIVSDIVKAVNDAGAKDKYSLVLDKSGSSVSGTPVLLYSQDVKDITDDVIKVINATKPADGAKPATTAPAPAPAH